MEEIMQITAEQVEKFQAVLTTLEENWKSVKPDTKVWLAMNNTYLSRAFQFLVDGVDQLVNLASTLNVPGADKKAVVLNTSNKLFDVVIAPILPIWVPTLVVKTLFDGAISGIIEFLVSKLPQTN
jgi:hypothetical protein